MRKRSEIQAVLRTWLVKTNIKQKEVTKMVELDQFKTALAALKEPLLEVRDSL